MGTSAWVYGWATLSPGVINTRPGPLGWGLGAGLTIQPCKKVIVTKLQKGRPCDDDEVDLSAVHKQVRHVTLQPHMLDTLCGSS
jgi:hypothetical protein